MTLPLHHHDLLGAIIESSPDAIVALDRDGRVTLWNGAAERLLGYSAAEIVGLPVTRLLPQASPEETPPALRRLDQACEGEVLDAAMLHRDGRPVPVSLVVALVHDSSGATIGSAIIARHAGSDVEAEARRANQLKAEFLSRVTHELRTPLNIVLGFGQLLQLEPLEPHQRDAADHILNAARHLLDLIDEVLDISRMEAGRLPLSIVPVSVDELFNEVLALLAPFAADRRIRLESRLELCDLHVMADRRRLRQVLFNLVSNGIKYNHEGGTVTVGCDETARGSLRVLVADTGIGIAPAEVPRLFIPFERLGADGTPVEGTGLGLSLSKGLTEAMGGRIGVESTPGQGSTFWVDLPRAHPPGNGGWQPDLSWLDPPGSRILCIQPQPVAPDLNSAVLARYPDLRMVHAAGGRDGIDLARRHRPALVLLDLHLPDIPASEVLYTLLADPVTAAVPVIATGATVSLPEIELLLRSGARAFLAHPLEPESLLSLIEETVPVPAR